MSGRQVVRVILLSSLCLVLVPFAASGQQAYDIEMGSQPGIAYSYIHNAGSSQNVNGTTYYNGGTKWFNMDGFLRFSLAGDILTINSSTLTATGRSGTPFAGESWMLSITGDSLDKGVATSALMGTIDYSFTNNGSDIGATNPITDHSGSFYFFNEPFTGVPNTFDSTTLALWGNNWNNQTTSKPSSNALGIDLGSTTVVPEPVSSTLFITGAGALGLRRFRRRKAKI